MNKPKIQIAEKDSIEVPEQSQLPQPWSVETFSQQSLDVLQNVNLLQPSDFRDLQQIREDLQQRFVSTQRFRSDYEARNSVLNDVKFPTPDAKYWQGIREQLVMYEQLVFLGFEYREDVQRLRKQEARVGKFCRKRAEAERDWEKLDADANVELAKIEMEKIEFVQVQRRKFARERLREILMWQQILKELQPLMRCGIESPEEHQPQTYLLRFQRQAELVKNQGWEGAQSAEVTNLFSQLEMAQKHPKNRVKLQYFKGKPGGE